MQQRTKRGGEFGARLYKKPGSLERDLFGRQGVWSATLGVWGATFQKLGEFGARHTTAERREGSLGRDLIEKIFVDKSLYTKWLTCCFRIKLGGSLGRDLFIISCSTGTTCIVIHRHQPSFIPSSKIKLAKISHRGDLRPQERRLCYAQALRTPFHAKSIE